MAKFRKIILFSLVIIVMAICFGCSQADKPSTVVPPEVEPEVCMKHTGNLVCENCGLNYYDELKSILISNGRAGGVAGSVVYDGKKYNESIYNISAYVIYDAGNSDITLLLELVSGNTVPSAFTITISHPSNDNSIKNCKYKWVMSVGELSYGTLNAQTFSPYTTKLYEDYTAWDDEDPVYDPSNNNIIDMFIDKMRSDSASYAQDCINYALIPLLNLGTKGLTVANFGFTNF